MTSTRAKPGAWPQLRAEQNDAGNVAVAVSWDAGPGVRIRVGPTADGGLELGLEVDGDVEGAVEGEPGQLRGTAAVGALELRVFAEHLLAATAANTQGRRHGPVRQAHCENYLEDHDRPCDGVLVFTATALEAACGSCGARCGCLAATLLP